MPAAAADIKFNPATTDAEFAQFARIVAQGIFPTPVAPARAAGVLGFDIGLAATAVKVDTKASWWQHAVTDDFSRNGYIGVPRLVASKGLGSSNISGSYAKVSSSGMKTYGGALDMPVIQGGIARPEIAVRASYATITGASQYKTKVYGLEGFISKGFGPVTPYAAYGRMRTSADGIITATVPTGVSHTLHYAGDIDRVTAGVRISLTLPKIAVEVTKAEVTSYAAKVSLGF